MRVVRGEGPDPAHDGGGRIAHLHLVRVPIGPLRLGDLELGQWRELTSDEINLLKK